MVVYWGLLLCYIVIYAATLRITKVKVKENLEWKFEKSGDFQTPEMTDNILG